MATVDASQIFRPLPEDEEEDVVFGSLYGLRWIELNRPRKYNALNGSMIRKIGPRLVEWEKSDMANVVVMKGAGDKAFCAGGDVMTLAEWNKQGPGGRQASVDYFALEYRLDHLIATYRKPYIAFMDGITMGGGVGLSMHAPFRIATERTVFAMPETRIGFFPDVGASFFLPRLPGCVGTYLALTSSQLTGVNAFYAGIATHYLHSTSLPNLESRLAELRFKDYDSLSKRLSIVNETIEEFCTGLPHDQPILLAGPLRNAIDACFSGNSVDEIIRSLTAMREEADAEIAKHEAQARTYEQKKAAAPEVKKLRKWAADTLQTLCQRSPTAIHVALLQMRLGRKWTIAETFQREHQIAAKFMQHPDFVEGVTAQLGKDRRTPQWQPIPLDNITAQDHVAGPFFEISRKAEALKLTRSADYKEYPFHFGLPTEQEVKNFVTNDTVTAQQVMDHFLIKRRAKQGVVEVVEEILARTCRTNEKGKLEWASSRTASSRGWRSLLL